MCGLTQVLIFIESVIRKKKGGVYVNWWVNKARVTKLGLVYACRSFLIGEHMSIWMSPFCFESSCARDGGMWWITLHRRRGSYLVVGVRGILFTMSHTATTGSSWPYMNFNCFLVTSVPGEGGVMPLHSIWAGSTLLWVPPLLHGFLGWLKMITPYYW